VAFYIIPKSVQNFCFEQYDARLKCQVNSSSVLNISVAIFYGHENVTDQKISGEEFIRRF
jgi:hypothetical protein